MKIVNGRKFCPKCSQEKSAYFFGKSKTVDTPDGLSCWCKECRRKKYDTDITSEVLKSRVRLPKYRFSLSKNRAKSKGQEWSLSKEEFYELIKQLCFYCEGKLPETMCELDRKNSDLGYTTLNVVPCCTVCNRMKGNHFTFEQMLELRPLLIKFRLQRERK